MIELKEYECAESILNHILENDPENQFAKREIEYIKQMRKNENNHQDDV